MASHHNNPALRWSSAIRTVIRSADADTVAFIASEIIDSGIHIEDRQAAGDDEEEQEDALHSVISEHLQSLLDIPELETGFISRDILDAYLYPAPDLSPEEIATRPDRCELCDRAMFLTIHHLFPRSEHTFLLRHPPSNLPPDFPFTKTDLLVTHRAWLCRPCHSAVHRIKSNRELGMEFWSVERLMEVEEIRKWVGYAGKQRASGKNHSKLGLRYKR